MDKIIGLTTEIKALIEKEPLVIEYRRIENLYQNNNEIKAIVRKIDDANRNKNEKLKNELIKEYNEHPLVRNYIALKEEVQEFLKEISKNLII